MSPVYFQSFMSPPCFFQSSAAYQGRDRRAPLFEEVGQIPTPPPEPEPLVPYNVW